LAQERALKDIINLKLMIKKIFLILLLGISALSTAQPIDKTRPINVIIPFNPGGGTDLVFRNYQRYAERTGLNVVPVYKPGANGIIGVSELARAPTDGYTIAITPSQSVAEAVVKTPSIEYTTVSGIGTSVWAIAVNPKSDINTFSDLVAKLKTNNKPVFGSGATGQLITINKILENLKVTDLPIIAPFNGAGPAITNLLGGHIDVIVVPMSTVYAQLDAGTLKPIAVIGNIKKYEHLPNLQKLFPAWKDHDLFGIILPKGAAPEVVAFWNTQFKSYLTDPTAQEDMIKEYTEPAKFGPDKFNQAVSLSKAAVKQ
jgi:tripartite-type tricarboxylate transporter receptor subunit TctC